MLVLRRQRIEMDEVVMPDSQTQALRHYLAGERLEVTYRKSGSVYGRYVFMTVHLCRLGNYMTFGQTRKQSVLDSHGEQVRTWRDQGRWNVKRLPGNSASSTFPRPDKRLFIPSASASKDKSQSVECP